jgi:hypothetical protein
MNDWKWDRWIQRLTVAAMVALAVALVGVGISLYAPPVQAESPVLQTHR